jgi:signal transduction histidine kinase
MRRLLGRLSVRVGLSVVLALLCALLVQLVVGRLLVEQATRPLRDRGVENALALLQLAFTSGALDGPGLATHFGAQDGLVIALYDAQGTLIGRSRDEPVAAQLSPGLRQRASARRGRFVYVTEPRVGEETAALLRVERDGAAFFIAVVDRFTPARLAQARSRTVALALGTMALFGLGSGFVLARGIRRRVLEMQAVVRRLTRGERSAQLSERCDDELGQLVRELERMASALACAVERHEAEQGQRRRMFADLSHELYTPLSNVLGYIESLGMSEIDSDPALRSRYLRIVQQQSQALAALIEDLRTLSRLECEGLSLTRVPTNLSQVLSPELEAFSRRAEANAQRLACEGETGDLWVDGDGPRMAQVLRNLLDNALRHSPAGETVRVEVARRAHEVVLSVSDRGAGIAPEHVAHLTERFYRVDASRARSTGGRGLGLAIARAIVEAHQGRLEIVSRVGAGTTVRVVLPAWPDATSTVCSQPMLAVPG